MRNQPFFHRASSGFTLVEMLVIVVVLGVLGAIAAPAWLRFWEIQRLNTSQDQVYLAIREAQSNAKKDKLTWQASFRQITNNGTPVVQWAVHRADTTPTQQSWQNLESNVRIDSESNLSGNVVSFNYQGCPVSNPGDECTTSVGALGRLTLSSQNGGKAKRCVIVSTLLGTLQKAKEQPVPNRGRYCY